MSDTPTAEAPAADVPVETQESTQHQQATEVQNPEAVLKAYQSEKERRKAAERELAALKSKAHEQKGPEVDVEALRSEILKEAEATTAARIRELELRAAMNLHASKFNDAEDMYKFVDVSTLGADGPVDGEAVSKAISDLLEAKPYLAAATAQRFQGEANGGPRGEAAKSQLSRDDLKNMTADQIESARREGRLDNLMSGKG